MWRLLSSVLVWMQHRCIAAVRFLLTVVSISVGSPPFRESPPDAPPKLAFRLLQMVRSHRSIRNKKILILDLDETLIHASSTPLSPTHFDVMIPTGTGSYGMMYVCERPYLQYFLAHVCQWFTVTIFTAATKEYASPIIHRMDRAKVVRKKYFRNDCVVENGQYVKNLARLSGTRPHLFSNYVIIDNLPASYKRNPANAIPISSFYAHNYSTDEELLRLLPLLEALHAVSDVRSILELRTNPGKMFVDRIVR
ncbi:CTD nuclear envelope phosphatase 1-like protein [Diplonema papillatum]|nr:CTD nuclear envelope phosphatase 1-like protein [Diplonema papillatum]|eukprot:gene4079-6338_t